jgi:hypothetical protein
MHVLFATADQTEFARCSEWLTVKQPDATVAHAATTDGAAAAVANGAVDCVVIFPSIDDLDSRWRLARNARRMKVAVLFVSDEPAPDAITLRGASVVGARELTQESFAEFVICLVASATGVHPLAR